MNSQPCGGCRTHSCNSCSAAGPSRRAFLASSTGVAAAGLLSPGLSAQAATRDPARQAPIRTAIKVQPVLAYEIPTRRQAGSWRNWGGLQTEQDAAAEKERIGRELKEMASAANFPLEILPLQAVKTAEEADAVARGNHDIVVNYAAGGSVKAMEALAPADKWDIMFVRHRSGPAYLWYEIAHNRFLRKTVDEFGQPNMTPQDVVVDSHAEILWRLRALSGLKNTLGKRVVCIGGASGWGQGGQKAPDRARELWKLDLQTVGYPELAERIKSARANESLVRKCTADASRYLKGHGVSLETSKEFVEKCFLLAEVFRDLLTEAKTDTMTINQCMGTVMEVSDTTACLPLSLLNDEGYMAFCESDFVVIPSGILMHYISGKPVFLNDPTYPHDNLVTLAHCTAPRKMDGESLAPVRILTHFESDFGAAPKVEMRKGQRVTNIAPDFASKKWVGFEGEIVDNPFMAICRSQIDVQIRGNTARLLEEMKGFHWMTGYGSHLRETGYALNKVGVDWLNVSA